MIKDKEQFENFIDILYPLECDEVYFLSLSARNKYLDKDEGIIMKLIPINVYCQRCGHICSNLFKPLPENEAKKLIKEWLEHNPICVECAIKSMKKEKLI